MFLKEILFQLIFKPSCELCHQKVFPCRFFCAECQASFCLSLSSQRLYQKKEGQIILDLDLIPQIKILKQRVKNPRNAFLVDALIALIILAFHELRLPWPQKIVDSLWLGRAKINAIFLRKLAKSMGCNLVSGNPLGCKLIFLISEAHKS